MTRLNNHQITSPKIIVRRDFEFGQVGFSILINNDVSQKLPWKPSYESSSSVHVGPRRTANRKPVFPFAYWRLYQPEITTPGIELMKRISLPSGATTICAVGSLAPSNVIVPRQSAPTW